MKQYRLLNTGERVEAGDEYYEQDGAHSRWLTSLADGKTIREDWRDVYRREYHEPAPAGWITDRKPTEADADDKGRVLAYDPDQGSVTAQWDAYGFDPGGEAPYLGFLPIPKFTPPPPEKKKVPLGPEDVPPGSEFHRPLWQKGVSATRIMASGDGVCMMQPPDKYHPSFLTYEELKDSDMEISRDSGKTWENCWKEVEG